MENVIINADFRTKEIIIAEIKTVYMNIHETAFWGSIRIGQGLKELKQLIPHGELTDYIQENLGFSPRKFQQYVQFTDQYGDENSPYFRAVSNAHTYADLNFSNALRLLTVPEDQVEDFVIENDVPDMTAKELEQKIKELHSEKDRTKELEGKLNSAISDRDAYIKRENDLVDQINSLQESVKSNGSEKAGTEISKITKDLVKAQKDKEAADAKVDKLQSQVDQIKKDQAQIIENEKKKAADEARKDSEEKIKILTEEKANAEKGLTFNEEMISFKFIVDSFQKDFESAIKALNNIKKSDPNKAENLRAGLKIVLAELDKSI